MKVFTAYAGDRTSINRLSKSDLFEGFFTDQQKQVEAGNLSVHTFKNRINALKQLTRHLYLAERINEIPRILQSKKYQISINRSVPKIFTYEDIRKLFAGSNDVLRLCILLGINCSLCQSDIANIRKKHIDFKNRRLRKEREKTGIIGDYKLWDITYEYIEKLKPKNFKPEMLLLTTSTGNPLKYERLVNGKCVKSDSIKSYYQKVRKSAKGVSKEGRALSFKNFRKTGAYWIEKENPGLTPLYLAHSSLDIRHLNYVDKNFHPLDPPLELLGDKLNIGKYVNDSEIG